MCNLAHAQEAGPTSWTAVGAFQAIRGEGFSIPDDVALVGFDETTWGELATPSITISAQPTAEIGRTATELLVQRIADPDRPPKKVILKGTLLERESSAPKR